MRFAQDEPDLSDLAAGDNLEIAKNHQRDGKAFVPIRRHAPGSKTEFLPAPTMRATLSHDQAKTRKTEDPHPNVDPCEIAENSDQQGRLIAAQAIGLENVRRANWSMGENDDLELAFRISLVFGVFGERLSSKLPRSLRAIFYVA